MSIAPTKSRKQHTYPLGSRNPKIPRNIWDRDERTDPETADLHSRVQYLLYDKAEDLSPDDKRLLIETCNKLNTVDTTQNVIRAAQILERFGKAGYAKLGFNITDAQACKYLKFSRSERLYGEPAWELPIHWRTALPLLTFTLVKGKQEYKVVPDGAFERLRVLSHANIRRIEITEYATAYKLKQRLLANPPSIEKVPAEYRNTVTRGDSLDLIKQLPDDSVDILLTSPPYAEPNASNHYPAWLARFMLLALPKLTADGSAIMVLKSFVENGQHNRYIDKTVDAIRRHGWQEPQRLLWINTCPSPSGSIKRFRDPITDILWFCKSTSPHVDLQATGNKSEHLWGIRGNVNAIPG